MLRRLLLACAAVLMLLPFFLGILFFLLLIILNLLMRPLLRQAGAGGAYQFIPVVFAATLALFVLVIVYLGSISYTISLPF